MFRTVVFDLDGTLVDSRAAIVGAARAALAAHGLPPPPDAAVLDAIGLPLADVLARFVPASARGLLPEVVDAYRHAYVALDRHPRPFDGVVAVLDALRGRDLAVATGKSVAGAERVLAELGWRDRFAVVVGHESVPRPKPHPDMVHAVWAALPAAPSDTVVIGDTTFDLDMGRAAGAVTCAVTWGNHPEARLRASAPDFVVHTPAELLALL